MNKDIVYEILKNLYEKPEENGGALLAKKIILSRTDFQKLEELNFEKPVVFEIDLSGIADKYWINKDPLDYLTAEHAAYYFADRKNCYLSNIAKDKYLIKVYKYKDNVGFIRKDIIADVHSIGNMTSLERMFSENYDLNKIVGSKLDTSRITDMSSMFWSCSKLDQNIGRNWNTSNVINMSQMFWGCSKLSKNVGKKWETTNLIDTSYMFSCCYSLDKNIGKNWKTKNIKNMESMFSGCSKINKPIGQNWDVSNVTNFSAMFLECKKLQFSAGKNWKVSPNISVLYCAKPDPIWSAEEDDF